ncbi:hypothetical protein SAY86_021871 [Trapa natans]|uniref:Uncharacterized protein n=1 Tax=Trapa natans TaxID=22666 RepID=A0AAN7M9E7_TRANT|nr:hypothetical protein SAY86_021871 [Trapa natans]
MRGLEGRREDPSLLADAVGELHRWCGEILRHRFSNSAPGTIFSQSTAKEREKQSSDELLFQKGIFGILLRLKARGRERPNTPKQNSPRLRNGDSMFSPDSAAVKKSSSYEEPLC